MVRQYVRSYDRERLPYKADLAIVEHYAQWLRPIDWRLFCTLTFAWRVNDQQAHNIFVAFIKRLQCRFKSDVGYVRGDEKRPSGCGKPACGRHYHVLLACAAPVAPEYVEALWMSMAGKRGDQAGAKVEPYNRNRNGLSYVLKLINQEHGDWTPGNLHLFLPPVPGVPVSKRMRRHLLRHHAREQRFASLRPYEAP